MGLTNSEDQEVESEDPDLLNASFQSLLTIKVSYHLFFRERCLSSRNSDFADTYHQYSCDRISTEVAFDDNIHTSSELSPFVGRY